MPMQMEGDFEIVGFSENQSILLYDNEKTEEYPTHWHNAVEIIMPLKNSFTVICDGEKISLKEREILIIPAGTLHNLKAQSGRRLIMLADNITISENPALTELSAIMNTPIYISKEADMNLMNKLGNIIEDIYRSYNRPGGTAEVFIYIKLLTLLGEVLKYRLGEAAKSADNPTDKFMLSIKYIEKNYMNEITLDRLSEISGYSKYYFSRMFSKYTGMSLSDFLNRRRIMAAELLLLDKKRAIIDIAMQTGFTNLSTFNRAFRKAKNCTPTQFRKLCSEINH
ncbi:MAG: helix-turn-helix domain-containing protein [Oscillospiraceae bacterium]|nr:helix-turn-helix domain-containing protein [Oscillospiraceae bacterium]